MVKVRKYDGEITNLYIEFSPSYFSVSTFHDRAIDLSSLYFCIFTMIVLSLFRLSPSSFRCFNLCVCFDDPSHGTQAFFTHLTLDLERWLWSTALRIMAMYMNTFF